MVENVAQSKRLKKVDSSAASIKSVLLYGRYSFAPFVGSNQAVWTDNAGWTWGHLSHLKAPVEPKHAGKWMALFYGENAITFGSTCVTLARDFFERGQLGGTMKFGYETYPKESYQLLFYTDDSRDLADVLRVLTSLRSFIPQMRLNYKLDDRTHSNCYAHNCTDGDLCLYHSPKSEGKDPNKAVEMRQNRPVRDHRLVVSDIVGVHLPFSHCVEVDGEVQARGAVLGGFAYTSCAVGPVGVSFVGALR